MRFLQEARAQARIDHPHVCRVYEVGEVEDRVYIALPLVDGIPPHRAAEQMSLDEKVAVMRDVAVAIQEAHRLGMCIAISKPANIMAERTADGRWVPVVTDFGLAHETTFEVGITESGTVLGAPAYMSPEQARGEVAAIDRRSDVYSLGATRYELMTGRPPFPASSLAAALAHVIHDDPPAPRKLIPTLPNDLETVVLKCLAKDPTQRYPSARALADDLGRYLAATRSSAAARAARSVAGASTSRAVSLGVWSLAVVITVTALGVRAWLISRAERSRTVERTQLAERHHLRSAIERSIRTCRSCSVRPDRSAARRARGSRPAG